MKTNSLTHNIKLDSECYRNLMYKVGVEKTENHRSRTSSGVKDGRRKRNLDCGSSRGEATDEQRTKSCERRTSSR